MLVTSDLTKYWPDDALKSFKEWANNGFPHAKADQRTPKVVISEAKTSKTTMRTQKDLRNLTAEELRIYQSKFDEILKVGALDSKWQELGNLRKFKHNVYAMRLTFVRQADSGVSIIKKRHSYGTERF